MDPAFFLDVEDLLAVQVDFQPAPAGGSQLDGDVARVLGPPEFRRQPRGDCVIPSRYAVDYFDFNFSELCSRHGAPNKGYDD